MASLLTWWVDMKRDMKSLYWLTSIEDMVGGRVCAVMECDARSERGDFGVVRGTPRGLVLCEVSPCAEVRDLRRMQVRLVAGCGRWSCHC